MTGVRFGWIWQIMVDLTSNKWNLKPCSRRKVRALLITMFSFPKTDIEDEGFPGYWGRLSYCVQALWLFDHDVGPGCPTCGHLPAARNGHQFGQGGIIECLVKMKKRMANDPMTSQYRYIYYVTLMARQVR